MIEQKEKFFSSVHDHGIALTYDDVRLMTSPSAVSPSEVDTKTLFSRNVELNLGLVSAAMDTVTESDMAIELAKVGGIGVIHAALDTKRQRDEVRRVKLHLNGLIENPVSYPPDMRVEQVLEDSSKRQFDFRTFTIVDKEKRLVGMLTQNDFDFCEDNSQPVSEVMTPLSDVICAGAGTDIDRAYSLMQEHKKKTLPLLNDDGKVAGLYILSDVLRLVRENPDQYNIDEKGRLRVAMAVPTDPDEAAERVATSKGYLDVVVIDSAQGDSKYAFETLTILKKEFSELDIVAGNVSSAISARKLAELGADGIKVGQGPGSICTTRPETGIGCPQVTAVYECTRAVEKFDIPVCADGGVTNPGDISIAIAAGAHSVMLGGMLAATKEAPGEIVSREGQMFKLYRGMGSPSAIRDSAAARRRYSVSGLGKPLAEGIEKYVPYRGPVQDLLSHYEKALKKSMSYCGAKNTEQHRVNTLLMRITSAGLRESLPHDVSAN